MSVHYVHAVNGDGINNVSLSTTYMLSTMAASIMSVCPLHTCCQRWHHQKCLSVHYLHAVNDDGIINVCLSTTYMLSQYQADPQSLSNRKEDFKKTPGGHSLRVREHFFWGSICLPKLTRLPFLKSSLNIFNTRTFSSAALCQLACPGELTMTCHRYVPWMPQRI